MIGKVNERVRNRIVATMVAPSVLAGALRMVSHPARDCVMEHDLRVAICNSTDVMYPDGEVSPDIIHDPIAVTIHHGRVLVVEMFEGEYCNIRLVGDKRFRNHLYSNEDAIRRRMGPNQEPIIFEPTYLGICVRRY